MRQFRAGAGVRRRRSSLESNARGGEMANGRLAQSRIGVLGSGEVGRRLAAGFGGRGHDVTMGSRDPGKPELRQWLSGEGAEIEAGTFAQAAAHGELVVLAGEDEDAKRAVGDVLADFGWSDVVDLGGIVGSRELEAICIAWVKVGGLRGSWDHGFKLLVG